MTGMEDHVRIIKKKLPLWGNPAVEQLHGGITNFNYLVTEGGDKHVARFAQSTSPLLGLDRRREVHNTRVASISGLGPKVVGFFPAQNCLVVEYVDGSVLTPDKARQPKNIKDMARVFRALHSGPKFKGKFDPFRTIPNYIATARARGAWVPINIDGSLSKLRRVQEAMRPLALSRPCHLDLMIENIVDTGGRLKLIDWEYSANSDPRFDLAMLSVKGNFTPRNDAALLKAYDDPKITHADLAAMKAVVHFREGAWGLVQNAVSKIPFDYKKYAKANIGAFNILSA